MNLFKQPTVPEAATGVDDGLSLAYALDERVKWESEKTPEALYKRINEISSFFSQGKYTKALASQRLLDLMYDINDLGSPVFDVRAKSRYYLLLFHYIHRVRSARIRIKDVGRRKLAALDQKLYFTGIDFTRLNLAGARITNAYFEKCNFTHANLQEIAASSCHFEQCRLDQADMRGAEISGSDFEGVSFAGSNFSSLRMIKSTLLGCDFSGLISSRGKLSLRINNCSLVACSFRDADLRGADFRNSRMSGCDTLDAKKKDAKGLS